MPRIVRRVAEREDDARVGTPYNIGALFRDVIDLRPAQKDENGEEIYVEGNGTGITLAQFIDHYLDFMRTVPFMYIGNKPPSVNENNEMNHHIGIWIDTSEPSSVYWDVKSI